MPMNVIWYGNNEGMYRGWWDMTLFEEFFKDQTHYEGIADAPKDDGAFVILPGRALVGKEDQITQDISSLKWVVLIIAGDEEGLLQPSLIRHPNRLVWVQNPKPGVEVIEYRRIGCGYTPGTNEQRLGPPPIKSLDIFFSGQITHGRRTEMWDKLIEANLKNSSLQKTDGFTKGLPPNQYLQLMGISKVAPCPSGPQTPDTFRLFEALELGCIPIADEATPKGYYPEFWNWLFNDQVPFPTFTDYGELVSLINQSIDQYPRQNNRVQAWWIRKKQAWKDLLFADAESLGAEVKKEDITVIVPVSPILTHPDTSTLEETINNIRFHLPDSKIIITFDGVRSEQRKLIPQYEEHIRQVLWKSKKWGNLIPLIFNKHTHQVGMAREALKLVDTPLILYCEQDTPLVTDELIEWSLLIKAIKSKTANVIRFHFEGHIPEAHTELMLGEPHKKLLKTLQWSQRPHLASTEFYKQMLKEHFTPNALCFIEDKVHGAVQDDYYVLGMAGWEKWKLFIYFPNDRNIKRSYHTDGRGQELKYDDTQIW